MNILVAASSVDRVGWYVRNALQELGHEASIFSDDNGLALWVHKTLVNTPFRTEAKNMLLKHKKTIGEKLKRKIAETHPNLLIVIQGNYFLSEDIRYIQNENGIPVVNWIVHDPVLSEFYDPLRLMNLKDYSMLFIADKLWMPSVYFFDKKVIYLPLAADSKIYKPLQLKKDIDVFFTGDLFPPSPHTASGLVYARALGALVKAGFRIDALVSGAGAIKAFVPDIAGINVLSGDFSPERVNELYNRAKIVLTLFPLDFKKDPGENAFAAAQAGAFQIAEYKENISNLFGKSLPTFQSLHEMVELVKTYLQSEEQRSFMAWAAQETVFQKHTYIVRAEELLREVNIHG